MAQVTNADQHGRDKPSTSQFLVLDGQVDGIRHQLGFQHDSVTPPNPCIPTPPRFKPFPRIPPEVADAEVADQLAVSGVSHAQAALVVTGHLAQGLKGGHVGGNTVHRALQRQHRTERTRQVSRTEAWKVNDCRRQEALQQ